MQDPVHVRPPFAIPGRMRIPGLIRELVMQPVNAYPVEGSALERHAAAGGYVVLQPARDGVSAVGKQSVVADGNTDVLTENPEDHKRRKGLPREKEEGSKGEQMEE